jgi:hypothetical protein
LLLPQIASAAVFSVTTLTDDPTDPGSLRSAVNLVNAGSGGDTINFSGFSGDDKMITLSGTITLNSTLTVSKSVTINGPGANLLTISGNNAVRVFDLTATAGAVSISGLTIAQRLGSDGGGGILQASPSTLTVNSCTFSGNVGSYAGSVINLGGAINSANNLSLQPRRLQVSR